MKLYLISQDENNDYYTYDSAIVAAPDEAEARKIHPSRTLEKEYHWDNPERHTWGGWGRDWASSPDKVNAEYIGELSPSVTLESKIILASFNAG